jgi:hypothetical protein
MRFKPAYKRPFTGSLTSKLLKQQCPTPVLPSTTPHFSGFKAALVSWGTAWHAALITALQLPTSGIPAGYRRNPMMKATRRANPATIIEQKIAMQEYPTFDRDVLLSMIPSASRTVTKARKRDCDMSQWRVPDSPISGFKEVFISYYSSFSFYNIREG